MGSYLIFNSNVKKKRESWIRIISRDPEGQTESVVVNMIPSLTAVSGVPKDTPRYSDLLGELTEISI